MLPEWMTPREGSNNRYRIEATAAYPWMADRLGIDLDTADQVDMEVVQAGIKTHARTCVRMAGLWPESGMIELNITGDGAHKSLATALRPLGKAEGLEPGERAKLIATRAREAYERAFGVQPK